MKFMIKKLKKLKLQIIYFIICRKFWKTLCNSESKNSTWEITHFSDEKTVTLHYVPEEDYSEKDIKIKMSYNEFEDLIKFIIRIS